MSLVAKQHDFLMDVVTLLQFAYKLGFVVTGGELYRPIEMQRLYVQQGRSKTMNSNHLRRMAIDLNFFKDGKLIYSIDELKELGTFWESLNSNNRWGGFYKTFKDVPHFERTD